MTDYDLAYRIVVQHQVCNPNFLIRKFAEEKKELSYNEAAQLIELLENEKVVGEFKGNQAREIFVKL